MTEKSKNQRVKIEIESAEICGWIVRQHDYEVAAFSNHLELCRWLKHHLAPGYDTAAEFNDEGEDLPAMFDEGLNDTISRIKTVAEQPTDDPAQPISIFSRLRGHKSSVA